MFAIIKDSFFFFRINFAPIAILCCIIEGPYILVSNIAAFSEPAAAVSFWLAVILLAASLVIYPFLTGAQIHLFYSLFNGQPPAIGQCLIKARSRLLPLVAASFISLLLTLIGLSLFIIPGIIVAARLSLSAFFIIIEDYDTIEALKRSFAVTREFTLLIVNAFMLLILVLIGPQLLIYMSLQKLGLYNFISSTLLDLVSVILSSLFLVMLFRIYCLFKAKEASQLKTV